MIEKEYANSVERLIVDIHAARGFLDRVERQIRNLLATTIVESPETDQKHACGASEDKKQASTHKDAKNARKGLFSAAGAILPVFRQDALFDLTDYPMENDEKEHISRKKCVFSMSKAEMLENLRQITEKKNLLDLADVNQILGFHKTTSSKFVKLAVKRGELGFVQVGKELKFLPVDVKNFVNNGFVHLA